MDIPVCTNVYVPLRMAPTHKSEMGSQVLLGEKYEEVDHAGSYTRIKLLFDGYSGWIDNDHRSQFKASGDSETFVIARDITGSLPDGSSIFIPAGSEITGLEKNMREFTAGNLVIKTEKPVVLSPLEEELTFTALSYLNAPYLWGGRTSLGMDCSGLVQTVYKAHGINIPRDSFRQAEEGITINLLSDAVPGDLLFFDNDAGRINHVGMLYDNGKIIHCSGKVRIDAIDHQGIFRKEEKRYTHRLRLIKRYREMP